LIEGRNWAVIMARGQSRRLGYPKGMARFRSDGPTLLEMVDSLYRKLRFNRLVVTLPELGDDYRQLLESDNRLHWLILPGGGDTALTLQAAWSFLGNRADTPAWVWAHPVDMPHVTSATLELLGTFGQRSQDKILRPTYQGQPGHPVVFPWELLCSLFMAVAADSLTGTMRSVLTAAGDRTGNFPLMAVPVQDPGVVRDYDDPQSLLEE
jgi:molybdenum cofactor cytidylyltransferase